MPDISEVIQLKDGSFAIDYSDGTNRVVNVNDVPSLSANPKLSDQSNGVEGYVGMCNSENFGMNWVRTPINYDLTSGTAAGTRNDESGTLAGTESATWIRMFFGLSANVGASGLFEAGNTNIVQNRLDDLIYILKFWHAKNKKVLLVLDGPVSSSAADMNLYRDRLFVMLRRLSNKSNVDFIDAVTPANEPYNALLSNFPGNLQLGINKMAELMRVTHSIFKLLSPSTVITTPCFQGGETWAPEAIMKATAQGCVVRGSDGAGTRGEMFMDVIAYHPYGIGTTIALSDLNFSRAYTQSSVLDYSGWVKSAIAARRSASDGGSTWWAGKPDPACWATEVNVSFEGGNITTNTGFRMQFYNRAQRARLIQAVVEGCFAAGYTVVMPYAVDHVGNQGPFTPSGGFGTASNGDIRFLNSPVKGFNGDVIFLSGGTMPGNGEASGIVYNASADGSTFDCANIPAGTNPTFGFINRWLLGGWHQEWTAIQQNLTGYMESGYITTSDVTDPLQPQFRINRGQVLRTVKGKFTAI